MKVTHWLLFSFFTVTTALAQVRQVTLTQQYSIDQPSLDIDGTIARIAYGTNFYFYSFHILGPESPIANPVRPALDAWGPTHVNMAHLSNNIGILYTDYQRSGESRYELRYVVSSNEGGEWSAPLILDTVLIGSSIMTTYTNQLLKSNTLSTALYAFWRNQRDGSVYFSKTTNPFVFSEKKELISSTGQFVKDFDAEVVTFKSNDYVVIAYAQDSSLYVRRSVDGGSTFSSPQKIDSLSGPWSYFHQVRVAGSIGNYFYIAASYWQMTFHHGEEPPQDMDMFGTRLYVSTDKGATWKSTCSFKNNNYMDIAVNTWNYLVYAEIAEDGNLYVKTSLDGKTFSDSVMVNQTPGSAAGKYDVGFDMKLDGPGHLAIAWVDTTTGYDEIFYRYLELPQPPATSVEGNAIVPTEPLVLRAYPNPFNPSTRVHFTVPASGRVVLKLYDLLGREVMTIADKYYTAGVHEETLDGTALQSGVYFVRLTTGTQQQSAKVLLVK